MSPAFTVAPCAGDDFTSTAWANAACGIRSRNTMASATALNRNRELTRVFISDDENMRNAPQERAYTRQTVSNRSSPLRVPAQLRSARFRIGRCSHQRSAALQDHAHRRIHQQVAQPSFVRERLHERPVLQLLQNLRRN